MGIWDVKKDEDRLAWDLTPLVGVGPLAFGMRPGEVSEALGGGPATSQGRWDRDAQTTRIDSATYSEVGVTVYYTDYSCLAGVAVDALTGPQVTLDGVALVARVPSELERWLIDHTESRELDLHYVPEGNPASADLGLMLRAQRAGDAAVTRPLFLMRQWMRDVWESLPASEWATF
ncbi:hypothetical protein HII36_08220 [Nonomuraea sp. NN258]|uniref:hypothetical protein n=1 Tax=Nonomuraea antri TaxID=2730852 RepID=UPI001568AF22|nr:hypothetical protein [Nonomuraea antri]NRQ31824.1 hypothetical protein [Nonomuraea antri]